MPRPVKGRKVCRLPRECRFRPADCGEAARGEVVMTVDEYEAVRLIDYQGFTQEECGRYMRISRTTVQEIYRSARRKLAETLVESRPLTISGGCYMLCDGSEDSCGCGGCGKHRKIIMHTEESKRC